MVTDHRDEYPSGRAAIQLVAEVRYDIGDTSCLAPPGRDRPLNGLV